jgi:hypothetical protein
MSKKHNDQIEISDLMADAISNAMARRNQAFATALEAEETLTSLSEDEANAIAGGAIAPPIIAGGFPVPPLEEM